MVCKPLNIITLMDHMGVLADLCPLTPDQNRIYFTELQFIFPKYTIAVYIGKCLWYALEMVDSTIESIDKNMNLNMHLS